MAKAQQSYRTKYKDDMIDNLTRQYVNQGLNPVKAEKQAQMDATEL